MSAPAVCDELATLPDTHKRLVKAFVGMLRDIDKGKKTCRFRIEGYAKEGGIGANVEFTETKDLKNL